MAEPNDSEKQRMFQSACPVPAAEPAYSEDGVDLTLIRWMLSLTPTERLRALQSAVNSMQELRNGRVGH